MLISILACSLGFHAITFERSTFTKKKSSQCGIEPVGICFLAALLRIVAENVITDRQTNGRTE